MNDVEKKQKLPINENTNFCIILNQHNPSRERDAHFLISVKKSKKDRKGTRKKAADDEDEDEELDVLATEGTSPPSGSSGVAQVAPATRTPSHHSLSHRCFREVDGGGTRCHQLEATSQCHQLEATSQRHLTLCGHSQ